MTRPYLAAFVLAMALGSALAAPLSAQVITFETIPAGAATTDDYSLGLADAYVVGPLSITFGFDGDLNGVPETPAVLELIGTDGTDGFLGCIGRDMASTGFAGQLGDFFLRGAPGGDFGLLVITYAGGAVSGASGEIWDIDGVANGTEQYRLRAYDAGGTLLAVIDSPLSSQESGCLNTELDGRPWTFSFAGVPGIARITIDFIGTKTNGIGLAFNNFNATGDQPTPVNARSWGRLKSLYR
jgi:hypothetical protein